MRDWLFVEDHCVAIDHILQADVAGQTFNVGGRAEHVNISIVRMICALLNERFAIDATLGVLYPDCPASKGVATSTLIASVKDRPGHDRRYAIDPTRIATELSFEPAQTLETGLRRTVGLYLSEREWWTALLS